MGGTPNSTRGVREGSYEVATFDVRLVEGVGVGQADEVGNGIPCKKHNIFQRHEGM